MLCVCVCVCFHNKSCKCILLPKSQPCGCDALSRDWPLWDSIMGYPWAKLTNIWRMGLKIYGNHFEKFATMHTLVCHSYILCFYWEVIKWKTSGLFVFSLFLRDVCVCVCMLVRMWIHICIWLCMNISASMWKFAFRYLPWLASNLLIMVASFAEPRAHQLCPV